MSIQAQYWAYEAGQPPVERVVVLVTAEDVSSFVELLAGDHVSDAILTHTQRPRVSTAIPDDGEPGGFLTVPDHSVIVGVHGGQGAMSYRGHDGHGVDPVQLYSRGSTPDHPVLYETDEFPPYSEIPVPALTDAVAEFLATAARPTNLTWQPGQTAGHL